jgi:hypothetical protein
LVGEREGRLWEGERIWLPTDLMAEEWLRWEAWERGF